MTLSDFQKDIRQGIPDTLPQEGMLDDTISHAPRRLIDGVLSPEEQKLAVRNALRYFPSAWHATLAPEFLQELQSMGRIYMHRFRPAYPMYARPIDEYPARSIQAAAIMLMIQNNLDPKVAKHPHELITYGGNGAVFQNWAQYRLVMKYLSEMTDQQTLVVYSGHPLGLFPAHADAPRVVVTNGMMIPNYSRKEDWNRFNALGVTQYGQMTAGSYMYIGPQGIVHGTTITLLNAGRKLGLGSDNLRGRIFVTSGLGGMSGAQALAAVITGCVGVIAEIDPDAVQQRVADGYIRADHVYGDVQALTRRMEDARASNEAVALVYHGNVVDLLEHFVQHQIHIDLGSDQTSCHNIDDMGYCPQGYSFEEAKALLISDKAGFMAAVADTLRRHARAINHLSERGMYFWDYGNAFLKEAGDVGAAVFKPGRRPLLPGELSVEESPYRYPSYVEDIMGPLCFDYGFGPFRWVCCSGLQSDLDASDNIAASVLESMLLDAPEEIRGQLVDNLLWIRSAHTNIPVVGSMARILYADSEGRLRIAAALNDAIARGVIKGPIVLGRDHHDVSGTDSPFRETANIYDGSRYTADMAVQNAIGDAFRGATWVSLHNGGGVGWGQVVNGGFGLVIDGSPEAESRLKRMLLWDVNNGIARRAWARNPHAVSTIKRTMEAYPDMKVTLASVVEEDVLDALFEEDTIITA
jgi:urocanate hydratase